MKFNLQIDHDLKLIRYTHTGDLRREDIGKAWDELLKTKEFTEEKYNLLSVYQEAKFIGDKEDVNAICDILVQLKAILRNKKQAMVIDEAVSTALSMLFVDEAIQQIGFIVKVFSTEEAAIKWLSI